MRYARQSKILEIIRNEEICTQEELAERLSSEGFSFTQATISRDIRELGLVKKNRGSGRSSYTEKKTSADHIDKLGKILSDTVISIKTAENLIVVTTLSGCASAAAEVIDRMPNEHVLGTIAGDNTILLIVNSKDNVEMVAKKLREVMS